MKTPLKFCVLYNDYESHIDIWCQIPTLHVVFLKKEKGAPVSYCEGIVCEADRNNETPSEQQICRQKFGLRMNIGQSVDAATIPG